MIDNKLTEKIEAYLSTPEDERDIIEGGLILLKLNHNRILFNNITRRPNKFASKVEYELKKFLKIRLDHKTLSDVNQMTKTVIPQAEKTINEKYTVISVDDELPEAKIAKGIRADHDELPEKIKKYWEDSAALYPKIKNTYEQLKKMESSPVCDRYELLKILDNADKTYRKNLQLYDEFDASKEVTEKNEDNESDIVKKISAARSFITTNKKKLSELINSENPDENKVIALQQKILERVEFLAVNNSPIDAANAEELNKLGLNV